MPLTNFQKEVLQVIVANRSEQSHFAGGLVLHVEEPSARYSQDFDIFHEAMEDLAVKSELDVESLLTAGFEVEKINLTKEWSRLSSFRKARVFRGMESVEVDWAQDSAFRFFPIVEDATLGWRLHLFDVAVNKALALADRTETRDYVDILELSRVYSLEAIVWAACGKDPGFSPLFLLKMMRRFARIDPAKLEEIQARQLDPIKLKEEWMDIADRAEAEIASFADAHLDAPIGVAFINEAGEPHWPHDLSANGIHYPSLRGCWPVIQGGTA